MRNPFRRRKAPKPLKRTITRRLARAFSAALPSIFRSSWATSSTDINTEIFWHLDPLRARSRDLAKNDPYFKRYLHLVKQNIVGPRGVRFQSRVKDPDGSFDTEANRLIEEAWRDWSKVGNFDVSARLSRTTAEQGAAVGLARDGEFLWRIHRGFDGNRFGYAVQVLEPERLDIKKNIDRDPVTGNRVVMGVGLDELGRAVEYHLLGAPLASSHFQTVDALRSAEHSVIAAADIIHGFEPEWPEQLRGVPWGHASMSPLNDLGGYREASLVNARVGAGKLGFWRTPSGDSDGAGDEITDLGAVLQDAEPGEQRVVPSDWEFEKWDPTYPLGEFPEFNKHLLRGAAAGLNVFYPMLGQDIENVNLSSIRGGLQDDREGWMSHQTAFVDQIYAKLFPDWLRWVLTMGVVALPMAGFDKFNAAHWQPRRWKSPDPLKDSQARALDWGLRTRSVSQFIEEDGHDPEEVFAQIARDRETLEKLGISPTLAGSLQFEPDEAAESAEAP